MKKLSLLLASSSLLLTSCGTNCSPKDLTEKVSAITSASTAYASDDSNNNCTALAAAYNAYLNGIDGCESIAQTTINTYSESLNNLPCK